MAEANMNIYQKLAKIRKQVEVMKRDAKGFNYTYTTEESILAKVTVQMDKLHLSLIPSIVPESTVVIPYSVTETKTTSKGDVYDKNVNEILVQSDMIWTWVNNDNPDERIEVPWAMVGQQSDASQAFGSGLTYSSRYFLLKYFNIATSDADPDAFRKKQKAAEAEEQKLIASEIKATIDTYLKDHVYKKPEDRDAALEIVSKYIKSGNYLEIKDPILARSLLAALQEKFGTQEAKE